MREQISQLLETLSPMRTAVPGLSGVFTLDSDPRVALIQAPSPKGYQDGRSPDWIWCDNALHCPDDSGMLIVLDARGDLASIQIGSEVWSYDGVIFRHSVNGETSKHWRPPSDVAY